MPFYSYSTLLLEMRNPLTFLAHLYESVSDDKCCPNVLIMHVYWAPIGVMETFVTFGPVGIGFVPIFIEWRGEGK